MLPPFQAFNGEEQERKLFVGGLNKVTDDDQLRHYFGKYGDVIDCNIMRDQDKRSRGFGFILFDDATAVDKIIAAKKDGIVFIVDDRTIEIKRALPKVPRGTVGAPRAERLNKKVFVGGLPNTIDEEEVKKYFEAYGKVNEVQLIKDRDTGKLRGFAFITFDDEDSADKCLQRRAHEIGKKMCEVKRAQTRAREQERAERKLMEAAVGVSDVTSGMNSALSVTDVNRLVQQAFLMGQGTHGFSSIQPTSSSILQALMGAASHATSLTPQLPTASTSSSLSQLAQFLQAGGLDTSTLGSLLKDVDAQRSSGTPQLEAYTAAHATSYPTPSTSYATTTTKEDYVPAAKRAFRPY